MSNNQFVENRSFTNRFDRIFIQGISAYRNGAADGTVSDPEWQRGYDYGKAAAKLVSSIETATTVREWDEGRQELQRKFPLYPSDLLTKISRIAKRIG